MVGNRNIIVNGLGNAHHRKLHPQFPTGFIDFSAGVHAAVAPVKEQAADPPFLQNFCNGPVLLRLQGVPAGADGGSRGVGQSFDDLRRDGGKIQQFFPEQAPRPADSSIDRPGLGMAFRLPDDSVKGGVDDGGGSAPVYHKNGVFHG